MSIAQALIGESLQELAKSAGLQSYEIPPRLRRPRHTVHTGRTALLTGIRKVARPKLKEHYGERLGSCIPTSPRASQRTARAAPGGKSGRCWTTVTRPLAHC